MIKIVEESDKDKFETKVNVLMENGYELSSSSCGFVNNEAYDFCNVYQAILVK